MNEQEATAIYDRLLDDLEDAATLLGLGGDEHWAAWLRGDAERIRAGDAWGLSHLLSAYGGMGSINDLGAPKRLRRLLSRIYDDASALQRDLNS